MATFHDEINETERRQPEPLGETCLRLVDGERRPEQSFGSIGMSQDKNRRVEIDRNALRLCLENFSPGA